MGEALRVARPFSPQAPPTSGVWGGRGPRGKGGVGAPLACPCPGVAPPKLLGREGLDMLGDGVFPLVSHYHPPPEEGVLALLMPMLFQKMTPLPGEG